MDSQGRHDELSQYFTYEQIILKSVYCYIVINAVIILCLQSMQALLTLLKDQNSFQHLYKAMEKIQGQVFVYSYPHARE